jgi:hypothetical protein
VQALWVQPMRRASPGTIRLGPATPAGTRLPDQILDRVHVGRRIGVGARGRRGHVEARAVRSRAIAGGAVRAADPTIAAIAAVAIGAGEIGPSGRAAAGAEREQRKHDETGPPLHRFSSLPRRLYPFWWQQPVDKALDPGLEFRSFAASGSAAGQKRFDPA